MEKRRAILSVFIFVKSQESAWVNLLRDLEQIKVPFEVLLISKDSFDWAYRTMCSETAVNAQWLQVKNDDPLEAFMEASVVAEGTFVMLLNAGHRLLNASAIHRDIEKLCRQRRSLVAYLPSTLGGSIKEKFYQKLRTMMHHDFLGLVDQSLGLLMHHFTLRALQNRMKNEGAMLTQNGMGSGWVIKEQKIRVTFCKKVLAHPVLDKIKKESLVTFVSRTTHECVVVLAFIIKNRFFYKNGQSRA